MRKRLLHDRDDVFVTPDFLSPAGCAREVDRAEAVGFADAPIGTLDGPRVDKGVRESNRVGVHDPAMAAELWARLGPFVTT